MACKVLPEEASDCLASAALLVGPTSASLAPAASESVELGDQSSESVPSWTPVHSVGRDKKEKKSIDQVMAR